MAFQGGSGGSLGSARGSIEIDITAAQRAVKQLQGTVQQFSTTSTDAVSRVATGIGLLAGAKQVGDIFGGALKSGIDFESALSGIQAVASATAEEMELLRQAALAVGKDTAFSAGEAAAGLEELIKAGFSAEEAIAAIGGSADLAAAAAVDLGTASSLIATAIRQYRLEAKDAAKVADLFAAAASASAADATEIGDAFTYVGATAAAMGVEIEDVTTAIAILSDNGLKGSMAGTALNQMLTSLINPSREAARELDKLSISVSDAEGNFKELPQILEEVAAATSRLTDAERLRVLNQIFGEQGGRAALNLLKSQEQAAIAAGQGWDQYAAKVDVAGAAGEQAATRLDNTKGSVDELAGSLDTASIVIGTAIAPAFRELVEMATALVNGFLALDGPLQAVIGGFVGAGGVVLGFAGAMTLLGPTVASFVASLAAIQTALAGLVVAMGPVGLAAAALAAAGAFLYLRQQQDDTILSTAEMEEQAISLLNTFVDLAGVIERAGALEITKGSVEFLNRIISDGQIAQERLEELARVQDQLIRDSEIAGTRETPVWQAMVEGGFINEYTAQILAANDANGDGRINAEEYAAALAELSAGFEITGDQATALNADMQKILQLIADPDLYGAEIAGEVSRILHDLYSDAITAEQAHGLLQAIINDTAAYSRVLREAADAQDAAANSGKGWRQRQIEADLALRRTTAAFQDWIDVIRGREGHLIIGRDVTDSVKAYREQVEQAAEIHGAFNRTASITDDELRNSAGAFADAREEAAEYREQLDSLVRTFENLDLGNAKLAALAAQDGSISIDVGLNVSGALADLERLYRVGVGNLKSIGGTVEGIQKWADELVNVQGSLGAIDDLLAKGLISQERYDQAQRAYNRLSADSVDIQESLLAIQAKQVPTIAKGVDALSDQLNVIEAMEGGAQAAALGFLDAGESARFLEITTQLAAAAAGELGQGGKEAMQAIVEGAVAADPYLSAMLEQMGIISFGTNGTVEINWDQVESAGSAMDKLFERFDQLITTLADIFNIELDDTEVTDSTASVRELNQALNDVPDSKTLSVKIQGDIDPGTEGGGLKSKLLGDWGTIDAGEQTLPVDDTQLQAAREVVDNWGTTTPPAQLLPVTSDTPTAREPVTTTPGSDERTVLPAPEPIVIPAPDITAYEAGLATAETTTDSAMESIVAAVTLLAPELGRSAYMASLTFNTALRTGFDQGAFAVQQAVARIRASLLSIGDMSGPGFITGRSLGFGVAAGIYASLPAVDVAMNTLRGRLTMPSVGATIGNMANQSTANMLGRTPVGSAAGGGAVTLTVNFNGDINEASDADHVRDVIVSGLNNAVNRAHASGS